MNDGWINWKQVTKFYIAQNLIAHGTWFNHGFPSSEPVTPPPSPQPRDWQEVSDYFYFISFSLHFKYIFYALCMYAICVFHLSVLIFCMLYAYTCNVYAYNIQCIQHTVYSLYVRDNEVYRVQYTSYVRALYTRVCMCALYTYLKCGLEILLKFMSIC